MPSATSLTALYPVIGVDNPQETAGALRRLFGLEAVFESDWYVHLKSPGGELQAGFVRYDHSSVPPAHRSSAGGNAVFVTVDADDVEALWNELRDELDVLTPLTDEEWGQRHFICRLPGGVMADVVQMLPQDA